MIPRVQKLSSTKHFKKIKSSFKEDTSYKIVALFVTLVLWITILGRKSTVLSTELDVELLLSPNHVVTNELRRKVRVKLAGPRMALKKFTTSGANYSVNLFDARPGRNRIALTKDGLSLPLGVKVVSIQPDNLVVMIRRAESSEKDKQ